MEVVIDCFCDRIRYPINSFQIGQSGTADSFGTPEMRQQGAFARCPDTRHIIQRSRADCLGPLGTVCADGEPVRLVAHPLNEVEHRIIVPKRKRRLTRTIKLFFASVAIDPFGNTNHWDI